ncbi:DinB family protein [Rhizobium sp. TRM95111]|uniref:DinB family protein n=1 Tax=Rhizobium alarense TaxID=2846851 RepID=UPI001F181FC9|nr:DinB family protein [Rhizobium alarense]MCF3641510.1 DinB family protein [Rhizobium alarense]
MIEQFRMYAAYNRWANRAVYEETAKLPDAAFRENKGAFFGSLHGTLNHLLAADRIWQKRFTGTGDAPTALDAILHDDFAGLRAARETEDARIIGWVDTLTEVDLSAAITYTPLTNPTVITHALAPALSHVFNHQTHHRGQCHMILTALGRPSLTLDLIYFLRSEGTRWL